ncbi:hypothetical protein ALP8811_00062 [Aliiroseovarius pelagivivens]|uniref:Uncharacterized protein n=1 Tax=Aliiroseovarius pelagivivens TaxID=1639690 RepID=A0A2R8AGE5_9RHOB|nr:hypothetical protein ALP8811_00062 [Aliiroseovarius pelagivivens]
MLRVQTEKGTFSDLKNIRPNVLRIQKKILVTRGKLKKVSPK